MAVNLTGLNVNSPAPGLSVGVDDTFQMELQGTFGGGGTVSSYDFRCQVSTDNTNWWVMSDTGSLLTIPSASPHPLRAIVDTGTHAFTVTAEVAGTYYIRGGGDRPSYSDAWLYWSGSQILTVTAGPSINSETLQDLSSISVTDSPTAIVKRPRQVSDTIDASDDSALVYRIRGKVDFNSAQIADLSDVDERQRWREILDDADLSYSEETIRKRTIELLDSWIGVLDSISTSGPPAGPTEITDELAATDSIESRRNNYRQFADNVLTAEALSIVRNRITVAQDAIASADSADALRTIYRDLLDELVTTDALVELRERYKTFTEFTDAADDVLTLRNAARIILDTVSVIDSAQALIAGVTNKELADALATTDKRLLEHIRVRADELAFGGDSESYIINLIETEEPETSVTDYKIVIRVAERKPIDTIVVADQIVIEGAGAVNDKVLQDLTSCTITDLLKFAQERYRTALDEVDVSDSDTELRHRLRLLTESIAATDNIQAISEGIKSVLRQEQFAVSDSSIELRQRVRELLDDLSATDTAEVIRTRLATILSDTLIVSDTDVRRYKRFRLLSESITIIDNAIEQIEGVISRTLSDWFQLVDFIVMLKNLRRDLADSATVDDAIKRVLFRVSLLTDLSSITDTFSKFLALSRSVPESFDATDTALATYLRGGVLTVSRTLLDNLRILDETFASRLAPFFNFIIKHSISAMDVDIGIERFHIKHNVEVKT